ncbi:MAG: S-layer homology domain-containing protein [Ruminiclostridium sp.]
MRNILIKMLMKKSRQIAKVAIKTNIGTEIRKNRGTYIKANRAIKIRAVTICLSLAFAMLLTLAKPGIAFARQGDSGYDGGISSGEEPNTGTTTAATSKLVYDYQEPCFLSGAPVIFSGTLTISKSFKIDARTNIQTLTTTYQYALANATNTLARTRVLVTTITPKADGQKTESTQVKTATENIRLNSVTYILAAANKNDYVLSKSNLSDSKPAVNYYNGTFMSKKTYHIGTARSTDTIVVESTGNYSGYDEYWSSAEAQIVEQTISQRKPGKADGDIGKINMEISNTTKKELKYYDSISEQTSFEGGYVQTQKNENILKYTAELSELDKNKAPTTKVNKYTNSLKLESSPTQISLVSPNLKQIKGHPSEEPISLMFGLEAFKDTLEFDPEEYISRAEFIDAFVRVAKEVPLDPALKPKQTAKSTKPVTPQSLFSDVSSDHVFFTSINEAGTRGIISGYGKFNPDTLITVAQAVTMMVNSMGLNGLAPNPAAVTSFKDNDTIPSFARPSMYVAEKIGLIQEDAKGNIHPNDKITKAKAADMMKAYIDYMSSEIRNEYMEKILSY